MQEYLMIFYADVAKQGGHVIMGVNLLWVLHLESSSVLVHVELLLFFRSLVWKLLLGG
jgi:hypothetical protein